MNRARVRVIKNRTFTYLSIYLSVCLNVCLSVHLAFKCETPKPFILIFTHTHILVLVNIIYIINNRKQIIHVFLNIFFFLSEKYQRTMFVRRFCFQCNSLLFSTTPFSIAISFGRNRTPSIFFLSNQRRN